MRWRDIRFEKPTASDADEGMQILQMLNGGAIATGDYDDLKYVVAWMPLSELPEFDRVPDPPEGWRFVEKTVDKRTDTAKFWNAYEKQWDMVNPHCNEWHSDHVYIVPIDPPKPKYRPFGNAKEFEPHRNKWWRYKGNDKGYLRPPVPYSDYAHDGVGWQKRLDECEFEDGSPFGIEVTE